MAAAKWGTVGAIVVSAAIVCAGLMAATPVRNYDVWHHMTMGEFILKYKHVPLDDLFSYNARHPWVNPSWLADVALFATFSWWGANGLVILKAAAVVAVMFTIMLTCRLHGFPAAGTAIMILLVALAARPRFLCRPLVFSFVLLALQSYLLRRYQLGGRRRIAVLLPLIVLLWANVHASFPLSLVLLAITALAVARARQYSRLPALVWVGLACVAACFVSPFGWRQVWHALSLPHRGGLTQHPTEWWAMPLPFGREGLGEFAGFWLLLTTALVVVCCTWRQLDRVDLLALIFFAALAISARRHTAVFAIGIVPVLAKHGAALARGRSRRLRAAATCVAAACCGAAIWWCGPAMGLGLDDGRYPAKAADFVVKQNIDGRMFNRWGWGSYLIRSCWPERRVFADGRLEVHDPDVYADHDKVLWAEPGWDAVLNKHAADYLIVPHNSEAPMAYQHPDWKLVFWDDIALVYVRNVDRFRNLIAAYECGESNPLFFEARRGDPLAATAMTRQLEQIVDRDPECIEAHRNLAKLHLQRGEWPQALRHFARVAELAPRQATSHHDLGLAYFHNGRIEEAIAHLRRAPRLTSSRLTRGSAAFRLSQCYQQLGEPRAAERWLRRSHKWYPGMLTPRDERPD